MMMIELILEETSMGNVSRPTDGTVSQQAPGAPLASLTSTPAAARAHAVRKNPKAAAAILAVSEILLELR